MDRGPPILGDLDLNGHKVFFALAKIAQTSFCNHICRVRVWMWICFFDIFIPQRRNHSFYNSLPYAIAILISMSLMVNYLNVPFVKSLNTGISFATNLFIRKGIM